MRIVGGKFRGKTLQAPPGPDTRPTSDRARESIFNILAHGKAAIDLDGISVLDLFCGTGALGLEAMSRGAGHGLFADRDAEALRVARANAASMGLWRDSLHLRLDGAHLGPPPRAAKAPYDLVFMDPPYHSGMVLPALLALGGKGWIRPGTVLVVEVAADEAFAAPRGYEQLDERTYGAAKVHFLKKLP